MRLRSIVTRIPLILSLVALLAAALSRADAAVFLPSAGNKLIVVGQDVGSIADYVSSVGLTPGGVTGYTGINDLAGFTTDGDWGAGLNNSQTLITNYQNSVLVLGVALNGQTTTFANSTTYDANLDTLINTLKGWNRPVLLRWGYEVDGPWNGYPPGDFKTGWIKVWNRIRALNAQNNIAMVWQTATYCPDSIGVNQSLDWYPGDQYVDWMGLSYFAPQDCNWSKVNDMAALARAHSKPLLIAESTPQRYDIGGLTYSSDAAQGSNKQPKTPQQIWDEWFASLFNFINTNADVIRGLAYINDNWNSQRLWNPATGGQGYWGDSRVQAQPLIRANWISEITNGNWLGGGTGLFSQLGFGAGGSPPPPSGAFGIDSAGNLYHVDGGWTASFNYLCLNSDCRPGTRGNGRFQRPVSVAPGVSYMIEFKVQDNAIGQCLTGPLPITYTAAGASISSPCASAGTPPPPSPGIPTGLTAGGATSSSLTVSWGAVSGAAHYDLFRNGAVVATPTGTSVNDAGLTPGTTFTYTVRACNTSGNCSAQSAPVSATTLGTPPTGTGGPFGIDATGMLFHVDRGWTASFAYLCLNDDCRSATRANGRFQRPVTVSPGNTYQIQFKVQDNAIGQCLTGDLPITYASGGASIASPCAP